jgi:hypothetical protein
VSRSPQIIHINHKRRKNMSRKLAVLAAMLVGITAFAWANIPGGLSGNVVTGPNSVMHTKALTVYPGTLDPYLPWTGTADADVSNNGVVIIKKGDVLSGFWGGRRATATRPGHLDVTLTKVNGVAGIYARDFKDSKVNGQDTWVAAGTTIPFLTCNPGPVCPAIEIH